MEWWPPHNYDVNDPYYNQIDPEHVHSFKTQTTVDDGHNHLMTGRTLPSPYGPGHVHVYQGKTSVNDRHNHTFQGRTSPPIPLPEGGHFHEFDGRTSVNDEHYHQYSDTTGLDMPLR